MHQKAEGKQQIAGRSLHRQRQQGTLGKAVDKNRRQPRDNRKEVVDSERETPPENQNTPGKKVDG